MLMEQSLSVMRCCCGPCGVARGSVTSAIRTGYEGGGGQELGVWICSV